MNPANPSNGANGQSAAPGGFNVDDAVFTVFRHKWLILAFVCLGVAGAVAVRFVRPPPYVSKAKLMVHYVLNTRDMTTMTPDSPHAQSIEYGAQSIINAETEIITSLDVAQIVADKIGPAKILAKKGGGTDRMAAAGVIASGIEVAPPRSSILTISFKHPDGDIVQPVLQAVLEAYMRKHRDVRLMPDSYLLQQREELGAKLTQTEEQLKDLKMQAKILFPDEMKKSYQAQIGKVQDELLDTERELIERNAMVGERGLGALAVTNGVAGAVPPDALSNYSFATSKLEELKRQESELLLQYKEAYPLVQNVRERIQKLTRQKADLEQQYPTLAHLLLTAAHGSTNTVSTDVLVARKAALGIILSNLQEQATQVLDLEPKIAELERVKSEHQKTYELVTARLEQQQRDESLVADKVVNMSEVESPTPPGLDTKKMMKLVGMVLAGCIGMGLGLAFLIDLFLDRSIKRASDIERYLRLPVLLSIPDTACAGWLRMPRWLTGLRRGKSAAAHGLGGNGDGHTGTSVVPWDPAHQLRSYTEGLRERIVSYFEVHNLNLKKPKLVAVTGCAGGAGVSTLASGLAAALSKTGDGNVLLVDMNVDQGVAHSFHKGKPGCGISDALEPENRSGAQVEDNLYVASLNNGSNDKLVRVLPNRFNQLMPRLKASDYDYIIFDMPPVTQTSATPRLASYMDLALLVLESEKTSQHSAARASALMREARANVAAVLNKHRSHMPTALSQEG
ncbi:MAG TPA: cellulose synthase operon protein YhjQ/BcsQ [Candidatus Paceibacterota bacterium]|nr:cellulose synthase operon protein YhjQ/BcsQ [Verrucomicrobiota bacterium]HSA10034.1 cellulose synthase operon protein YhjQ/BcsQ [Candidatus Paceibacterota bacterium]